MFSFWKNLFIQKVDFLWGSDFCRSSGGFLFSCQSSQKLQDELVHHSGRLVVWAVSHVGELHQSPWGGGNPQKIQPDPHNPHNPRTNQETKRRNNRPGNQTQSNETNEQNDQPNQQNPTNQQTRREAQTTILEPSQTTPPRPNQPKNPANKQAKPNKLTNHTDPTTPPSTWASSTKVSARFGTRPSLWCVPWASRDLVDPNRPTRELSGDRPPEKRGCDDLLAMKQVSFLDLFRFSSNTSCWFTSCVLFSVLS